ncbi:hypothetical protein H257_17872 [Aphanomyces astaci]|uniref:Uncharacterized protein n=1 Tax=Aphanomyces astaci TaxID=112090 RepID=W4FEX8_APHAT|nr:hypothetical protein H257_17872 [Aphanomyces astaci]ETV65381.1 hypothetical protein H257_17872 [Aphanomyces astaci]|eukprot:XP_009845126.1 hypothetical protein H257_17872 [Aphanomyces astaci]
MSWLKHVRSSKRRKCQHLKNELLDASEAIARKFRHDTDELLCSLYLRDQSLAYLERDFTKITAWAVPCRDAAPCVLRTLTRNAVWMPLWGAARDGDPLEEESRESEANVDLSTQTSARVYRRTLRKSMTKSTDPAWAALQTKRHFLEETTEGLIALHLWKLYYSDLNCRHDQE